MKTAKLGQSMHQTPTTCWPTTPTPTTTSVSKTSVLVGLCFLAATFTFAIGNALIRSYFSNGTAHTALVVGVFLLVCCGLAVAVNGASMRQDTHAVGTTSSAGLPGAEGDGVPHTCGSGRVLPDKPRALECVCACGLRGIWCCRPRPLVCPADFEGRAEEPLHAGRHRLSRLLAGKRFGHVQPHQRDARRRDVGAGHRRSLRVDPANVALYQGVHFPWIRDFLVSIYRYALREAAYVGSLLIGTHLQLRRLRGNRSPENEGTHT